MEGASRVCGPRGKEANWATGAGDQSFRADLITSDTVSSCRAWQVPIDIGDIFSCHRLSTKHSFTSARTLCIIPDHLCSSRLRLGAGSVIFLPVVLECLIPVAQTDYGEYKMFSLLAVA